MIYAIVENNLVTNVIEWDGVTKWDAPKDVQIIPANGAGVGWAYDGSAFTAPPMVASVPLPQSILTADALAAKLVAKGVLLQTDVTAAQSAQVAKLG